MASIRCQRHCDPSDMAKERHKNLELPLPGKAKAALAPVRRKATSARARTSRRELLLFDYQTWLTLTAGVVQAAAAAETSGAGRR